MRFTATILILILTQTVQKASSEQYDEFVSKADLVVVAGMTDMDLVANGKKTSWKVIYKVTETLKGEHPGDTVTVQLDSESFKKRAKSGGAGRDSDDLLILFLVKDKEQSFRYAGPPLNSLEILASEANLAAVRAEIAQLEKLETHTWYKVSVVGVILIAAFTVALIVLAFLVHKRRQISAGSPGSGDS